MQEQAHFHLLVQLFLQPVLTPVPYSQHNHFFPAYP